MQQSTTYTELAHRAGDGVAVSLLWRRSDNRLRVAVADARTGEGFELDAHPENALDVFYHPFAHAAFQGFDYGVATGVSRASAEAVAS
jgi:hypothetical protein